MIYDILYRDGANYKQYITGEFPDNEQLIEGDEVLMERSGMTVGDFFRYMGWSYDPDYDHNILEILGPTDDQDIEADIIFNEL